MNRPKYKLRNRVNTKTTQMPKGLVFEYDEHSGMYKAVLASGLCKYSDIEQMSNTKLFVKVKEK